MDGCARANAQAIRHTYLADPSHGDAFAEEFESHAEVTLKPSRRGFLRGAALAAMTGVTATGALSTSGFSFGLGFVALPALPRPSSGPEVQAVRPALSPYHFASSQRDLADWANFKERFIDRGRVIDTGNRGVSHSEGQGSGMMFAVALDDPKTFDEIWNWTRQILSRPNDALHAWRYDPHASRAVSDSNNATDGDLLIAGALSRAARRWGNPAHAQAAKAIAADIILKLVRPVAGRTVLLPGTSGFERRDATIVNLSYYAFPFLTELAAISPSPHWRTLIADGLALMEQARFGRWGLPPDWLQIDASTGALAPARDWPSRFSYDAIRVPLYLAWGGCLSPQLAAQYQRYWKSEAGSTAWVDLRSGATSDYPADPGMRAIGQLVMQGGSEPPPRLARLASTEHYYAAALLLFTRLAWREAANVSPRVGTSV